MEPLVFDGVGTVWTHALDGTLKYIDNKVNKVMLQMQLNWQNVMGGDSGYAFHYTAQDLQDKVSFDVPRYSPIIAEMAQGADTISGSVTFDENEDGILLPTDGYTVKAPAKFGGTIVALSDEVYLNSNGVLTPLTRVASAPTATEYAIDVSGKITSAVANDGKPIFVVFKWTMTQGTRNGFTGTRRPKPIKFLHRFTLINDKTGLDVPCQLTIWKALGGGTLDATQERKKANVSTISLEIMEPDKTADNPNGYAAELIFGI
jgi:hypothetical protein